MDRIHLLRAVPSFVAEWESLCAIDREYHADFPDRGFGPEEASDFLMQLAWHVGARVASGDLQHARSLFAALEEVYARADETLERELTVGFLESLIIAIEHGGGAVPMLDDLIAGARVRSAWKAAYAWTHPAEAP